MIQWHFLEENLCVIAETTYASATWTTTIKSGRMQWSKWNVPIPNQ